MKRATILVYYPSGNQDGVFQGSLLNQVKYSAGAGQGFVIENEEELSEAVDRAIVDKAFGNGRDVGLMLHNNYTKSPTLEWAAGVFNGTGDAAVTMIRSNGACSGQPSPPSAWRVMTLSIFSSFSRASASFSRLRYRSTE